METEQDLDNSIKWIRRLGQTDPQEMRQMIAVEIQAPISNVATNAIFNMEHSAKELAEVVDETVAAIIKIIDPYLPPIMEQEGPRMFDNTPRSMDIDIAKWVFLRTIRRTCKSCQAPLFPKQMMHYDHPSGWNIPGYGKKQWVYITCKQCGHQWSLTKLGVTRFG